MNAEYDLIQKPNPDGDNTPQPLYPCLVSTGKINTRRLLEEISVSSTYTVGDLEGMLKLLEQHSASYVRKGYTVQLGNIGFLQGTLKATRPVMDKKEIRSMSIYMNGVKFRPSKDFKQQCSAPVSRAVSGLKKSVDIGREKRIARLKQYLDENLFIGRPDYTQLTGLQKNKALAELKEFVNEGILISKGRGNKLVFLMKKEESL